ncbi:hypothetical protein ACN677_15355 [Lactiplantibacillus paraplantarum]|uniref:hypothetical protein n=1 Tax=Lactiplantibacillus paraplantarum TaxID=60520 RepID=UPI003B27E417
MFDYPDNDNQKGRNGQSNTDREIGAFAGVLIGGILLLIALGLFLPALIVSFIVLSPRSYDSAVSSGRLARDDIKKK